MPSALLPRPQAALVAQDGRPTPEFYNFLLDLDRTLGTDYASQIEAIAARLAALEEGQGATLRGIGSVQVRNGIVTLLADEDNLAGNSYYGANAAGVRGFWPVVDAIQAGYGLDKEPFSPYAVLGTLDDPTELPPSAAVDDAYLIDGNYWAWDGTSWSNVGPPSNIALLNVHRGIEADDGLLWNPTSIDYDVGPIVRNPMTTTGDMIYATPGKTPSRLPIGANGSRLIVSGGAPTWAPETKYVNVALSDMTTNLAVGAGKAAWFAPEAGRLVSVFIGVDTASSSGIVRVDMNNSGGSVFSTRPAIDATEATSITGTPAVLSGVINFARGDKFSWDIDDAGTGAKGLQVCFEYEPAP